MQYLGDFAAGQLIDLKWNSNGSNGQSITRATNGTIYVYKDNSTTEISGVIDTEDFDAVTGVHHCRVDTSEDPSFYAAGHDYQVVLKGAIIDGQTVNAVLAQFSIENRSNRKGLIEVGVTELQAQRAILAVLAGAASGMESNTPAFKAGNNPGTTRVAAATDSNGNRASVNITA